MYKTNDFRATSRISKISFTSNPLQPIPPTTKIYIVQSRKALQCSTLMAEHIYTTKMRKQVSTEQETH